MHKVFGTDDKVIKGSPKIWVYTIDQIPVMSADQVQGENYIYDYRITRTEEVKKKIASSLTAAILDSTQYLYGIAKKCPFMGKYAIQYRQGNKTITIIISSEPCDKVIIFAPGSIIDKKHIDLKDKNTIVSGIEAILNSTVQVKDKK